MTGLVVKNTGSWYQVRSEQGTYYDCRIKGNLRLQGIRSTNPIAVGDYVDFTLSEDNIGSIHTIHDRKNYIIRRSSNLSKRSHILAANLDLVILIATVNYPETSTIFIDRFIASAEAYSVPACLIINKIDLYDEEELQYAEALQTLYETVGYHSFMVSAVQSDSLHEIKDFLKDKTTLVSGNSGVGKSTLINSLLPESIAKTAEISYHHNRGVHTTTFSEMYELENGGQLIDTPGIKGFGTIDMEEDEISHYFKEIFKTSKKCRFTNCTHTNEPDCAVLEAVKNHHISSSRYQSYLSMLSDLTSGKYR
jgi:ribosome biogenesis GTPase